MGVQVRVSKLVLMTNDYHILHQSLTDSLAFNWTATGKSEDFKNVTEMKFESLTRTRSARCCFVNRTIK